MKFSITFGFKNGLDFQFSAEFLVKCNSASLRSTYKIFFAKCYLKSEAKNIHFKRKKRKKKKAITSSGGFQKSKFF
jgi:hypothetical protein